MQSGSSRLTGPVGGSTAGSAFAIAATVTQGTPGLFLGAGVLVITTLIGADGVFWPLMLLLLNRHQRWAWIQTKSVAKTLRLDEPARQTIAEALRARAGTPVITIDHTPAVAERMRGRPRAGPAGR